MHYLHRLAWIGFVVPLLCSRLPAVEPFPESSQLPSQTNLPDPLVMQDGRRVTTREEWTGQRRPELKALFQYYMYGAMPPAPKTVRYTIERVDTNFLDGAATKKEISMAFDSAAGAPVLHLLLVMPDHHSNQRPFPVFVGPNFCGNFELVSDPSVPLPDGWLPSFCPDCVSNRATEAGRGKQINDWAIDQSIGRGYAVASFFYGDIEPDKTNATAGLRAWLRENSSGKTNDTGAIAAWAWGISRAIDFLERQKEIDPKRIAAVGHSRLGKAALLAAALDERIALTVPLQAGCGGTAPSRGTMGESVKSINDHFPHWFNSEFKKFNDHPDRLPFDQHCLMALVAPRMVLIGCAVEDTWSNPPGQFEMMRAADPVYRLLGVKGMDAKQMSEVNHQVGNRLGYFIRPGKHSMTRDDWKVFLDYADKMMP